MSDEDEDFEITGQHEQKFLVTTPTGATQELLIEAEQIRYDEMRDRYLADNKLTNASDLATLDQILFNDIMCYRWTQWVLSEKDYFGEPVTLAAHQKSINDTSKETRELKKALGMDKLNRDKDRGDSVAEYIAQLRLRARAFGIKRNTEAVKSITLWKELIAKVMFYQNCTEEERKEFHGEALEVMDWIVSKNEEIEEIDKLFREEQTLWIRSM